LKQESIDIEKDEKDKEIDDLRKNINILELRVERLTNLAFEMEKKLQVKKSEQRMVRRQFTDKVNEYCS
jgi:hypothetical protein